MPRERAEETAVETPDYEPMADGLALLRRFGSNVVHLAAVDRSWLTPTRWIGPSYWALHEPAATLCGAVLRPDHRGLVAMKFDTKKVCARCNRRRGL